MKNNYLLNVISQLKLLPIHPQWFAHKQQTHSIKAIKTFLLGTVLDIGCADRYLEKILSENCVYIGLDYLKTTSEMYHTTPTLYGDAHFLPIQSSSVDSVALLDVLEHVNGPEKCMSEVQRVLKTGGKLCLQVPFIYPVHDAPFDFHRWSYYGLEQLLKKHGFHIESSYSQGKISETFSLLTSIGLAKISLELIKISKFFIAIIPFTVVLVFISNLLGFLLGFACRNNSFMPFGYLFICRKK